MRIIHSDGAPPVNGHYSQAVVHDGTVYVSGQLGRGPGMTDEAAGGIDVQTRRSLDSIRAILQAAGSDFSHVLKVNIYIPDIALWPAVNAVYEQTLDAHRPTRAVIPTNALHFGALIEIDAIAAIRQAAPDERSTGHLEG